MKKQLTDEEINKVFNIDEVNNNFIKKIGNCYLTNNEIDILNRYNIDYLSCNNNRELLYLVEECIEEVQDDELEWLSSTLSERVYYIDTNK